MMLWACIAPALHPGAWLGDREIPISFFYFLYSHFPLSLMMLSNRISYPVPLNYISKPSTIFNARTSSMDQDMLTR